MFVGVFLSTGKAAPATVPAPDFHLTTTDGATVNKTTLKGKPVLMMFWAPWCHVCRDELPILAKFVQKDKPAQLEVLAVAFADTRTNVEEYIRTHRETFVFPTAYDEDNIVAADYGMRATPTFVVLNDEGNIELVHQGGAITFNPQYRQFLEGLRSQKSSVK